MCAFQSIRFIQAILCMLFVYAAMSPQVIAQDAKTLRYLQQAQIGLAEFILATEKVNASLMEQGNRRLTFEIEFEAIETAAENLSLLLSDYPSADASADIESSTNVDRDFEEMMVRFQDEWIGIYNLYDAQLASFSEIGRFNSDVNREVMTKCVQLYLKLRQRTKTLVATRSEFADQLTRRLADQSLRLLFINTYYISDTLINDLNNGISSIGSEKTGLDLNTNYETLFNEFVTELNAINQILLTQNENAAKASALARYWRMIAKILEARDRTVERRGEFSFLVNRYASSMLDNYKQLAASQYQTFEDELAGISIKD